MKSPATSTNLHSQPRSFGARLFGVLSLLFLASPLAAQTQKIAYVDMQRLIENAPQVAVARNRLAAEFQQRDQQLKAAEARLLELEAKQKREAANTNAAVKKQLATDIELLKRNVTRMRETMRNDLNSRSAEELNKRWPEIHDAVVRYAREQKIDLVVESPVVYASASIDITDEVLARLRTISPSARAP